MRYFCTFVVKIILQMYSEKVEKEMLLYYSRLTESQKRQYAYLESEKLPYGGQKYICKLLKITPKTVRKGKKEIENPEILNDLNPNRQRRWGGGRKKKWN
jgi:hypothetical protein